MRILLGCQKTRHVRLGHDDGSHAYRIETAETAHDIDLSVF
jgi:hypothetical protein